MDLMGLEPEMLAAQTRWLEQDRAARCIVLRGSDAEWVDHCAPFALGASGDHHRLALDHNSLAEAPEGGPFAPLSLVLANLSEGWQRAG
jgi:hypothetical protein